ncbi:MAG: ABC transporter ATP-binding protein/permease [Tannerellaceae bacterium]|jgi:ATP-binding cassette subfamily B protein/subfamily B ATP-binding cassette protein MsbA|nr:ABC transporter ATP-binding protein/permease [Tannerellaceae bacterium]
MFELLRIFRRFVPPYKSYLIWNVVFNVLAAVLNLFSFALIIPILNILFKMDENVYTYMEWNPDFASWDSLKELGAVAKNNFFAYVSEIMAEHGGSFALVMLGLFLVLMTFLKVMATYLASFTMIPIRTGVVRDIRNQINDRILHLSLGFFSEERKGDILARVSGDVNEIEASVMSSLDMLFKNPILIAIYLTGMLLISWQLTLFVLILLPAAGYVIGQVGKTLKRRSLAGQEQWGMLMSMMEETLGGLRIIKAFNAEEKIRVRFEKSNEVFRRITNRIYRRQQMSHPMSEFLGTLTIAIVLWYGGSLILGDNSPINASTFIYYLVIFYSIINPAKDLSKAVYAIQKGLASMIRIDRILTAEPTVRDPDVASPITLEHSIRFSDVWFKYKDEWILKGINLLIPKGKTIALVGPSGSGKSTLVDLIPRFYDVTEGSIAIDGVDIREASLHDLRGLMGNVNQEAILFNDSFYENIAFGVDHASPSEVENAARIANAHDFIMATDGTYAANIGDRGGKLSGGQRQRISIARAILKNPPILILDEATSALDAESERLVQEALENLMRNRTTIVIAHRLSTIRNADEICVMNEGAIIERGSHEELLALNGYYKQLYEMQSF